MISTNPFLDPDRQGDLYGNVTRPAARSGALLRAKTAGLPVPVTIVELVATHRTATDGRLELVVDIGCGRGTGSRVLAERLKPNRLVGLDASLVLVNEARRRVGCLPGIQVAFLQGDFHQLPLPDESCALAVAAFCLYHSPHPERAIAEIARVLAPGGLAVLVTKELDSYREMDALVATAGLDPHAQQHESLYTAAHSGNLADLAKTALGVVAVEHEEHIFTFHDLDHAAQYLVTNPKYDLAPDLYGNPRALAATLREWHPDQPVSTSSVITYVVARRRGGPA
ncbi:class I SAM-dependent methyltransferase [Streptomyces sp. H27-D2]|uniref:class I SAM-dependent methyltransferase n=1 Tax=Streptomyces sp. H27-D2 TaxID=3046304 RepID=UPI002DBAE72E|nr:class I SAM-dependent methyltransferase [Streptomyces sp. H27-D2]MEC4020476.1 class I SAM-dependent methyltransferase [Streptomyces sp. H27-D2]